MSNRSLGKKAGLTEKLLGIWRRCRLNRLLFMQFSQRRSAMINILLVPPYSDWSVRIGNQIRWDRLMHHVPRVGNSYSLVSDVSMADFVVTGECEDSSFADLAYRIRKFTRHDIQTFVWDSHDRPTGHKSGFYCSLRSQLFDERRHTAMSYPGPYNDLISSFSHEEATLDFSFAGQMSAGVRVRLIEQFRRHDYENNRIVRETGDADWPGAPDEKFDDENLKIRMDFVNLLRKSKFVLCPRGYGLGSFRLFEVMQAGRVPVIISDNYVKPAGVDWESCSITVPEAQISEIPEILRGRADEWEMLATNARTAWEAHFSPQHVMDNVAKHLLRMSENISQSNFSPWSHSARVGVFELADRLRPMAGHIKRALR